MSTTDDQKSLKNAILFWVFFYILREFIESPWTSSGFLALGIRKLIKRFKKSLQNRDE